jgi:hypothetical protein
MLTILTATFRKTSEERKRGSFLEWRSILQLQAKPSQALYSINWPPFSFISN